ncbi:GntR family transcriptional regulator [Pseudomonas sp. PICF141]|nr:GntR family transcriptional regulator [Pseudomonas sp. PICF141]
MRYDAASAEFSRQTFTMENPIDAPRLPRKRRSLAQELVTVLSEQIRDGHLKRGDKLPTESAIMDAHGVSRTVVREAISRLQAAGQVETRHGIGTFVLDTPSPSGFRIDPATVVTLRDVLAILELRISLEVESAGLAAQRRTPEQLALMRAALDALNESVSHASDAVASDFQFHLQIALATGNRYFTDIMTHLGTSIIPRTRLNSARLAHDDQQHYMSRLSREHEEIYDAIARQDSDAARAAMRLHLTNSRERLRQAHEEAQAQRG